MKRRVPASLDTLVVAIAAPWLLATPVAGQSPAAAANEAKPAANHRSWCPFGIPRTIYHARTQVDEYIFMLSLTPFPFTFHRFLLQSLHPCKMS